MKNVRWKAPAAQGQVPYLSKQQIEQEAKLLLAEFASERGTVAVPPIPIDEIAELHLKLSVEFKDMKALFSYADVHGALWVNDRLIGIDQNLDPAINPSRRGRYHFTMAHETGHWRLHRHLFTCDPGQLSLLTDEGARADYVCRSSETKKPIEWQADFFAASLLMPRTFLLQQWSNWRGNDRSVSLSELHETHLYPTATVMLQNGLDVDQATADNLAFEEFSRPLAEIFKVSPQAMSIRLQEVGLLVKSSDPMLF